MSMTIEKLQQPLFFTLDVKEGLVRQPLRTQLMKGDKKANRIVVLLKNGSEKVDLSGVPVSGSFIKPPDGDEIYLPGSVEDGMAVVELDDACYTEDGHFEASVALTMDGFKRTIVSFSGEVLSKGNGVVIDIGNVIPSIEEIAAQYAEMKSVTEETRQAADNANAAAGRAPYIDAQTGTWFVWDNAKGDYVDTGIVAEGTKGDPGQNGMTPHIGDNGNWWIGDSDTGTPARGPAGANGTGAGTVTAIKIGDNTYEPDDTGVVKLDGVGGSSLPAGGSSGQILAKKTDADGDAEWVDPPEGTMKSVCGKEADESGNVDLDATDVGAVSVPDEDVPAYGEATGINADMLGGVAASEYARKSDIPAADPDAGAGLPAGGSAGQILAKKSDADGDVEWKNETTGASYDQSLNKADDVTFNSISTTQPINAGKLGGKEASAYVLTTSFEEWTFTLDDGSTVTKKVIVVD